MTNPNLPYHRSPEELKEIEEKLGPVNSEIYERMRLDRQPIKVEPAKNPKGPTAADIEALEVAQRRIGHLTGSLAVSRTVEL